MNGRGHSFSLVLLVLFWATYSLAAQDICKVCGKPIEDKIYIVTDHITGEKQLICSNCLKLPACFLCGMPVNSEGLDLGDGRHLCARDKQTAVVSAAEAERIAFAVNDQLDRLFSRFTSFPTNVDVAVIDRIDVDKMFQPGGYDFESPNLLGCIAAETNDDLVEYKMSLMTGLPRTELQATAAHEYTHAWVGENVDPARRKKISRDSEEGFCELVAYLLMGSQNEAEEKKSILKNFYTRGQVQLFIEAEQRYGFDQILDWMQYGVSSKLVAGQLEKLRDVSLPAAKGSATNTTVGKVVTMATNATRMVKPGTPTNSPAVMSQPTPNSLRIQGLFWDKAPSVIINGHTVFTNDRFTANVAATRMNFQCLEIRKDAVRLRNLDTGKELDLDWAGK